MRRLPVFTTFALILLCSITITFADHGREIQPKCWQQDATINDIYSLNENVAWAVGDQGLILRTVDGGKKWIPSEGVGLDLDYHRTLEQKIGQMRPMSQTHELYPLTCSFKSVFFLDEKRGWVAGTYHTPYLKTSRSVLLTTADGGRSWHEFKNTLLPEISRIHFQDLLGGWAIGNSGNLYTSGLFATSTGGRNWSVQEVKPARNWIDGELITNGFVVIDDEGVIGRIVGKKFEPSVVFGNRPGRLKSVRMLNNAVGWAVGYRGTILRTEDGGQSWKRPETIDKGHDFSAFDFSTLFIREGRVWIAGNPGTTVISMDARTASDIKVQLTNHMFPIEKLYFASKSTGWAVGAGGNILTTKDGGKNWRSQRDGVDQTAIMVVSAEAVDLPFGLFSYYSMEQNHLSSLVLMGGLSKLDSDLTKSAINRLGCSTTINIFGGDMENEQPEKYRESVLAELVRTIRTLRPNIFVCNRVPGVSDNELRILCRTAIELAAQIDAYQQQMDALALEPWKVDRLLVRHDTKGDINLAGSRYMPKTGKLIEDQIAISRGLVGLSSRMTIDESYTVETFTGTVSAKREDIFFGLEQLGRFVPARRKDFRMGNLTSIATSPMKNREFKRLLGMAYQTVEEIEAMQNQIRGFANGMEAESTAIWMMQLAEVLLDDGNLEAAAFTLEEMVSRYSEHSLTPAALMWLAQYYSSEEVIVALNQQRKVNEKSVPKEVDIKSAIKGNESQFAKSSPVVENENGVRLVNWEVDEDAYTDNEQVQENEVDQKVEDPDKAAIEKAVSEYRYRKASQFLKQLKQTDPDLGRHARIQFMEAQIVSKIPGNLTNGNLLKSIKRRDNKNTDFVFASNRELVARGDQSQLLKTTSCFYTEKRPFLDGDLNDEIWQSTIGEGQADFKIAMPTGSAESTRSDVCWLAHDDEFFYLAVRCNKMDGAKYAVTDQPRQRDSDLSRNERIQLKLDLDRDLQSEFCFEIDYRGWANDSCAGAIGWDPDWFVAVGQDDTAWSIEVAIPWSELHGSSLEELDIVAISLKRLDRTSTNIWSDDKIRRPQPTVTGIAAGLTIAPKEFDLVRFVRDNQESQATVQE